MKTIFFQLVKIFIQSNFKTLPSFKVQSPGSESGKNRILAPALFCYILLNAAFEDKEYRPLIGSIPYRSLDLRSSRQGKCTHNKQSTGPPFFCAVLAFAGRPAQHNYEVWFGRQASQCQLSTTSESD